MNEPAAAERSPVLIASAVALPVMLIVGVIVAAVVAGHGPQHRPVTLGSVPAPGASAPECAALVEALPSRLGDYAAAEIAAPVPAAARAWQAENGDRQVVLRCGLERPLEFTRAAPLQLVDGVQWFEVSGKADGVDASTWFAVDRGPYVALTVPNGSGPTPLQSVSDAIAAAMPARPVDPGPLPN